MSKLLSGFFGIAAVFFASAGFCVEEKLGVEEAIALALAHDPRIDEKQAFVRKAEGLLQEAEGSEGFRYSVDSFLALATGLDGGFYEDGDDSCSGDCKPRDDATILMMVYPSGVA